MWAMGSTHIEGSTRQCGGGINSTSPTWGLGINARKTRHVWGREGERIYWATIFSWRKIKHIVFSHAIHYMYVPSHILGIALPPQTTPAYSFRYSRTYRLVTTSTDRPLHEFTTIQSLRLLQFSTYSSSFHIIPASIQEGNSFRTA